MIACKIIKDRELPDSINNEIYKLEIECEYDDVRLKFIISLIDYYL